MFLISALIGLLEYLVFQLLFDHFELDLRSTHVHGILVESFMEYTFSSRIIGQFPGQTLDHFLVFLCRMTRSESLLDCPASHLGSVASEEMFSHALSYYLKFMFWILTLCFDLHYRFLLLYEFFCSIIALEKQCLLLLSILNFF